MVIKRMLKTRGEGDQFFLLAYTEGFLWGPGYFAPYQSPQIFQEYVSSSDIDALIEPIFDSNMTTARLNGTTIDSPSFGVYKPDNRLKSYY